MNFLHLGALSALLISPPPDLAVTGIGWALDLVSIFWLQ